MRIALFVLSLMLAGCGNNPGPGEPPADGLTAPARDLATTPSDFAGCVGVGAPCVTDDDCCPGEPRGDCTEPNRCHTGPDGWKACSFC